MRLVARVAAGIAIVVLLAYAADAAWVRVRVANHHDPTGTVKVRVLLAVPQKGGRTEFIRGDNETQSCVHSLFPQLGLPPCWYVERHTTKRIDF